VNTDNADTEYQFAVYRNGVIMNKSLIYVFVQERDTTHSPSAVAKTFLETLQIGDILDLRIRKVRGPANNALIIYHLNLNTHKRL